MAAGAGYTMNGEPTAYWPIGWPGFLSLAFRAFGSHLWVGLALQVLISTGIAVLVYLIARRVTGSGTVGLVGAVAWTLLPDQLAWTSILGSEPLFAFLLLCGLYALVALDGWRRPAVAGLALGAACVVRPTVLLVPAVLVVILVAHHRRIGAALAEGALLLLVMLAMVAPLTIRNAAVLGAPVLVSTNGGVNLWQGVHADDHYWWPTDPDVNPLAAIDDEVVRDRMGQRLFLEHLATDPAGVAGHAVLKILALYEPPDTAWWWAAGGQPRDWVPIAQQLSAIPYYTFLGLAAVGLTIGWRRWRWGTLVLGGFAAYHSAIFGLFPASDRFRYPLMPVYAVFAGIALVTIADRLWLRTASVAEFRAPDDDDVRRIQPAELGGHTRERRRAQGWRPATQSASLVFPPLVTQLDLIEPARTRHPATSATAGIPGRATRPPSPRSVPGGHGRPRRDRAGGTGPAAAR